MVLLKQSKFSLGKAVKSRFIDGREYHGDPRSVYVLAKDGIEKKRLHQQHIWLRDNFQLLLQPQILTPFFEKKIDVYDIGCGTGSWVLDMAVEYPNAQYYGTDMTGNPLIAAIIKAMFITNVLKDMFPQTNYPENCHFAIGNVLDDNPFGKQFDFIQMRFFAVALREKEWDEAYLNMYNQLKPGGYFQVLEPDNWMHTTNYEMNEINTAFKSFLISKGQYPNAAHKVTALMKASGFNIVEERMKEVPIGWGNTNCVQGAEGMRALYMSIASDLSNQLNITVEDCKAKINRACNSMGPTQTTMCQWSFLAQKPF